MGCFARFLGTCMVRLRRPLIHVVLLASPRPTTARLCGGRHLERLSKVALEKYSKINKK
jgi:hypothetical protein